MLIEILPRLCPANKNNLKENSLKLLEIYEKVITPLKESGGAAPIKHPQQVVGLSWQQGIVGANQPLGDGLGLNSSPGFNADQVMVDIHAPVMMEEAVPPVKPHKRPKVPPTHIRKLPEETIVGLDVLPGHDQTPGTHDF